MAVATIMSAAPAELLAAAEKSSPHLAHAENDANMKNRVFGRAPISLLSGPAIYQSLLSRLDRGDTRLPARPS